MKTLQQITQTENKAVNLIVLGALTLIASALILFAVTCIIEPSHIANASF